MNKLASRQFSFLSRTKKFANKSEVIALERHRKDPKRIIPKLEDPLKLHKSNKTTEIQPIQHPIMDRNHDIVDYNPQNKALTPYFEVPD